MGAKQGHGVLFSKDRYGTLWDAETLCLVPGRKIETIVHGGSRGADLKRFHTQRHSPSNVQTTIHPFIIKACIVLLIEINRGFIPIQYLPDDAVPTFFFRFFNQTIK